ncbi:MAG: hypothetical protein ACR2L2_00465 [Acidobacteriota bacterium]
MRIACWYVTATLKKEAQEALLQLAFSVSPVVEETAFGLLYIDISGLQRLSGSEQALAGTMLQEAAAAGFPLKIGIASNPATARVAARVAAASASQSLSPADPLGLPAPLRSRLYNWSQLCDGRGSDIGWVIVPPGNENEFLAPLPLECLEIPAQLHEVFARWGISSLGELAGLPEAELFERLGSQGRFWQQRARGIDTRPLVRRLLSAPFEEAAELEWSLDRIEPLVFILSGLLDSICKRLEPAGLGVDQLRLLLQLEGGFSCERLLRLPFPMRKARVLLSLLRLDLESNPPPAPIIGVTLQALPARSRHVQFSLLEPALPCPEKLSRTLARLAALVGEENLGSPRLLNTHRPGGFRLVPFEPERQASGSRLQASGSRPQASGVRGQGGVAGDGSLSVCCSLRRLTPARPAQVQLEQNQPIRIFSAEIHSQVITVSGPWRSSGDWWRSRPWQRDEWDVGCADGSLWRIYQRLEDGCWFVEGAYD